MIHSVHLSGINRRFIGNKPQVYLGLNCQFIRNKLQVYLG